VRYGSVSGASPGRKGEPVKAENRKRSDSTAKAEPTSTKSTGNKPIPKRPHDNKKKETTSPSKVRIKLETLNNSPTPKAKKLKITNGGVDEKPEKISKKNNNRQLKGVSGKFF
jgi:hypothetical protein